MQSSEHAILFDVGRAKRVLRRHLFLNDAFLHEILVSWIAQSNDAACESVWVVLCLQLHLLLLLVLVDCLQAILVQMRRLVGNLLLQLLLLQ